MSEQKSSNLTKVIVKAMGLFGGVQMMGIICSIVRTKFVALWLGSAGVGLFGLWNSALDMINTGTNLGMRSSSVRDLSQAQGSDNQSRIARVITVVRKWSMWLGMGGALLTVSLAPILSKITFSDYDHIWGFVALATSVLVLALTNGEQAILQGTKKLKQLGKASLFGSIAGLAVSIPMFYFLRIDSVLPSIIAYSVAGLIFTLFFRNKEHAKVEMPRREVVREGQEFIKLGLFMTIGTFLTVVGSYVFNAYLNAVSGEEMVGYYQSGYTLVTRYTGLVLSALGVEYFPRLSQVADSKMKLRVYVSQEINISLIVLVPIITAFILLRSVVVEILYSSEFQVVVTYVSWMLIGTLLRAFSWCVAFVMLAKGDGRTFVVTELLSVVSGFVLNVVFYQKWGLNGLGISFVVWYVLYNLIVGWVYYFRYRLSISAKCYGNLAWTVAVSGLCMLAVEQGRWLGAVILVIFSTIIACVTLRKMWQK